MPEIEVSEEQRERIGELEDELAAVVVGKYGTVRTRDAIEYLLDRYEADGCVVADVVEENGGSVAFDEDGDRDGAGRDGDAATETDDEQADDPGEDDSAEADESDDDGNHEEEAEDETDDGDDEEEAEGETDDGDDEEEAEADDSDESEADGDGGSDGSGAGGGGSDMLNAMMSLLDEHDDKWGEGSGDDRYEVELPDGSTEAVRTKDDVRALLFKHYR